MDTPTFHRHHSSSAPNHTWSTCTCPVPRLWGCQSIFLSNKIRISHNFSELHHLLFQSQLLTMFLQLHKKYRKDLQLKLSISVHSSLFIYSAKVLVRPSVRQGAVIPPRSPSRSSTEACAQELCSSLASSPGTGLSCIVDTSPTSPVPYPCCYLAPASPASVLAYFPLLVTPWQGCWKMLTMGMNDMQGSD